MARDMVEWIVAPSEKKRLAQYLQDRLGKSYSIKQIKRWIESNRCQRNGVTERFASTALQAGDHIFFDTSSSLEPTQGEVISVDRDLLFYNKPPKITSESLTKSIPNCGPLCLVHRLDKDTSGIIVLARHPLAKRSMEQLFYKREVEKIYIALVNGVPEKDRGTIQSYLAKVGEFEGQAIYGSTKKGLYAETSWRCLAATQQVSLLACYPKTGRTHQIRVHLKELKLPILGDYQYDRQQRAGVRPLRQMLHAWKISFDWEGNKIAYCAKPPQDFLQIASMASLNPLSCLF